MLQIIVFCILFGYFITKVPDPHRAQMKGLFEAGFQIMMKLTHFIILFAPIGVFGLVVQFLKALEGVIPVKDASSAGPAPA